MNKIKKYFLIILVFIIIVILFKYNYILEISVINGVNIWLTKVFPTLFIMFIINDLIINLDILKEINATINPFFNKIFKTSGNASNVFLLSIFSGTPSAAFIIKEMLNKKQISLNDANKLIAFTFFSNPLFLYAILSLSFNKCIVIKIILFHYLSNIIIGIFFKNKYQNNNLNITLSMTNKKNVFLLIPTAISKSLNTLIMILGTIVFYMIITNLITNIFHLPSFLEILLKGFLEITQSLNALSKLNVSSIIKEISALAIISFGGLSIHTQVLSIINGTNISYKNFLLGRILHVLISTNAYFLFYLTISC